MNPSSRIVALVLAAGYSSRMGAFKPLAPLGPSTLIEESIARFHKAGVGDVRVVVGHRSQELIPVLERLGARYIMNPDPDRGMFSSVLVGVRSFEPDVQAFFLLPADIPLIKPQTIRSLLDRFREDDPRILYPRFNGERGHPPLIPTSCLAEDLSVDYPGGLRALLETHEAQAVDVDVVDEGTLLDCDTPSDYHRLTMHWSQAGIPTEAECEAICSGLQVPEPVVAHCYLVAEVARLLAVHLNLTGYSLEIPLLLAAGRLHDIARDRPDHARAGAALVDDMGYPRVAKIVASHTDIQVGRSQVNEAELIYYADKCVEEDRLVSLDERFDRAMKRHADRPDILQKVRRRLDNARTIGERIATAIGSPPAAVLARYGRSIRAASMGGRREIYLARHGAILQPDGPKRFIGQLDLPLTDEGLLQAERLSQNMREIPLSAIFCSDLTRTLQTAEIIARVHGLECQPIPALREVALGQWEGRSFEDIRREQPEAFKARGWDILNYHPPDGESFFDCTLRVVPVFYDILGKTRGNVLIVAHAGVNRIILSQMLGRSMEDLFEINQDYGCLNMVVARHGRFEVKLLNDLPFHPGSSLKAC